MVNTIEKGILILGIKKYLKGQLKSANFERANFLSDINKNELVVKIYNKGILISEGKKELDKEDFTEIFKERAEKILGTREFDFFILDFNFVENTAHATILYKKEGEFLKHEIFI